MLPSTVQAAGAKPSHTFACVPRNKGLWPAAVSSAHAWISGATQSQRRATARAICGLQPCPNVQYALLSKHTHTHTIVVALLFNWHDLA